MAPLTPFQADYSYCVYCHAKAAGPCAICGALICGDCCELKEGTVKKTAICTSCARKGLGNNSLKSLIPFLLVLAMILGALVLIGWLVQ